MYVITIVKTVAGVRRQEENGNVSTENQLCRQRQPKHTPTQIHV